MPDFASANPNLVDGPAPTSEPEVSFDASLHFDGACRPNPGEAICGWVIAGVATKGVSIAGENGRKVLGYGTNNIAEWQGVIHGLSRALALGFKRLDVYGDSNIVIGRMRNRGQKQSKIVAHLRPLYDKACELAVQFDAIRFTWVPREENEQADALT